MGSGERQRDIQVNGPAGPSLRSDAGHRGTHAVFIIGAGQQRAELDCEARTRAFLQRSAAQNTLHRCRVIPQVQRMSRPSTKSEYVLAFENRFPAITYANI